MPERLIQFVDGKRQGFERIWNKKGLMIVEAYYSEDRPAGTSRRWHPNGTLAKEIAYSDDNRKYTIKRWDSKGEPIEQEEVTQEDYYEKVAKQMGQLTYTLEEMLKQVSKTLPLVANAIEKKQSQSPSKTNLEKDLETLKQKMTHLQSLNEKLQAETDLHAESAEEPLWKNPSTQRKMDKDLENLKQIMAQEMAKIEKGIKDILRGIKDD
jgi:hypothetical protein